MASRDPDAELRDCDCAMCFYCGRDLSPKHEHDHLPIPKIRGGKTLVAACVDCHNLKDRHTIDRGWTATQALNSFPPESARRARLLFMTLGLLSVNETTGHGPELGEMARVASEFVTGTPADYNDVIPFTTQGWHASEVVEAMRECDPGLQRVLLAKLVTIAQAYSVNHFPLTADLPAGFLR